MSYVIRTVELEHPGAHWTEGDNFYFTALSLSDKYANEYIMDILIDQSHNTPLTFRHRHTLEDKDKIIPIFGRVEKAGKVELELDGKKRLFMRDTFKIPLKAPNGKDLDSNIIYAEWVKKKYDEGEPVGISHHFQTRLEENGEAYYANMLEVAGTPYPADTDCENRSPQETNEVEIVMNEQDRKKLEKMNSKELQETLEKLTLELKQTKAKLEAKEEEIKKLSESAKGDDKSIKKLEDLETRLKQKETELEEAEEEKSRAFDAIKKLSDSFHKLEADYNYEKTKGPLVRKIISLEKRPELEAFYRGQDEEYLEKRVKELSKPRPDISRLGFDQGTAEEKLEEERVTLETVLESIHPSLRGKVKDMYDGGAR